MVLYCEESRRAYRWYRKYLFRKESNINKLKVILANQATKILHGEKESIKAEKTARETFVGKGIGQSLPEIKVTYNNIEKGLNLLDFLSNHKITSSKSEARRIIANKGLKINDILVSDEKKEIFIDDFKKKILKISYGKKKHYIVRII